MSGNQQTPFGDSRLAGLRIDEWIEPGCVGRVIVGVTGDVDDETAPSLLATLTRALLRGSGVCCDLRGVGSFGATGADVLAIAHLTAAVSRGSFSVRGVHGGAAQVLAISGLDRILDVCRDSSAPACGAQCQIVPATPGR